MKISFVASSLWFPFLDPESLVQVPQRTSRFNYAEPRQQVLVMSLNDLKKFVQVFSGLDVSINIYFHLESSLGDQSAIRK